MTTGRVLKRVWRYQR